MANPRLRVEVRRQVRERADFRCEYCLSPEAYIPDGLSIEHIQPRARDGESTLNNLALSCQRCNNLKFVHVEAPDPLTNEPAPLYHPRLNQWEEHFYWSEDTLTMLGKTPTGRATVERLQLNREGVIILTARQNHEVLPFVPGA